MKTFSRIGNHHPLVSASKRAGCCLVYPPSTNICDLLPKDTPYQLCSPWPQFGGLDNKQQRRTPIVSSQTGNLLWQSQNTSNLVTISTSSPIISSDGTIYIGYTLFTTNFSNPISGYFTAFNSNGTAKWALQLDNGDINDESSSAIGPDGTNYFVANNDTEGVCYLYAISSTGTKKWKLKLQLCDVSTASITIGNNGDIFVCGYNSSSLVGVIYGVSQNGTIISGYPITITNNATPSWNSVIKDGPAISSNGNLYVCATEQTIDNGATLYSINTLTKTKVWEFNVSVGFPQSRPALSSDESTVYFTFDDNFSGTPGSVYAVNANDGTQKWQYNTTSFQGEYDTFPQDSFAIGTDGTIYFIVNGNANETNQNSYGKLIALDSNGNEKWRYIFGTISTSTGSFADTSPIIGGDGTIYVGVAIWDVLDSNPGNPSAIYLTMFAITPQGTLKWSKITTSTNTSGGTILINYATSPAIGLDGTIYIGTFYVKSSDNTSYSKMYAIK
jgi:outer membrane protein assembly factor BamB